jgi:hypothetical protein
MSEVRISFKVIDMHAKAFWRRPWSSCRFGRQSSIRLPVIAHLDQPDSARCSSLCHFLWCSCRPPPHRAARVTMGKADADRCY